MKKRRIILWSIFTAMLIIAILSIMAAITTTGDGFLDLSNIARGIFISIAVVCGFVSIVIARKAVRLK